MLKRKLPTTLVVAGLLLCMVVVSFCLFMLDNKIVASSANSTTIVHRKPNEVITQGDQVLQFDEKGVWLATFTKGARTVILRGPSRTFSEPSTTKATITTDIWVRLYPTTFDGSVDRQWLQQAAKDNATDSKPDVFQVAMQYIAKAPNIKDDKGMIIAGDAGYGPIQADGSRQEGADYSDFLGITETYGTKLDRPETAQKGDLDCSGFQRMVWGYRMGLALSQTPSVTNDAMPRRAFQILDSAPGLVIAPNSGRQLTDFSRLQPGDLVFHDASRNDGTQIDHVGIYLGIDSNGHRRFISSRKTADGPTFGDVGGKSVLDGKGLYATSFRAIRRL